MERIRIWEPDGLWLTVHDTGYIDAERFGRALASTWVRLPDDVRSVLAKWWHALGPSLEIVNRWNDDGLMIAWGDNTPTPLGVRKAVPWN